MINKTSAHMQAQKATAPPPPHTQRTINNSVNRKEHPKRDRSNERTAQVLHVRKTFTITPEKSRVNERPRTRHAFMKVVSGMGRGEWGYSKL